MRKLISSDEAVPLKRQHKVPCSDCPFRRDSIAGWVGSHDPQDFIDMAITETTYNCHSHPNQQCAGMAVFRGNICKMPRSPEVLRLPADRVTVFTMPVEFLKHHRKEKACP